MSSLNSGTAEFGDLVTRENPDNTITVLAAPQVAPIKLAFLIGNPAVTYDTAGICIGGHVWYQPIDLTDAGSLLCTRVYPKGSPDDRHPNLTVSA